MRHPASEIVGLQLAELSDTQRDELALLIAERTVVFFRDQHTLSPQAQRELGAYFGDVEVHPSGPQVPGLPGITVIWDKLLGDKKPGFRNPFGSQNWHTGELRLSEVTWYVTDLISFGVTDLVHEKQPPGITHLHNDTVPDVGGDTYWASGYAAYDKLSPQFRELIDGLSAVYRSAHAYPDPNNPEEKVHIERIHPLVRVHPVTGWKSLFLNRVFT